MRASTVIEGSSVYRRSDAVVARQVGPEVVLVPVRQNVGNLDFVYTLSPVAARAWSLLDGTRSLDEAVGAICAEFDVGREEAAADLAGLLADLSEVSLVSRVA